MLAQRFIAVCDHDRCRAKTKVTVTFWIGQAVVGIQQPVVLQPKDIKFSEDGWAFQWNTKVKRTEIYCPDHNPKDK